MIPDLQPADLADTITSLPIGALYLTVEDDGRFVLSALNDPVKALFKTDEDPVGRAIEDWQFPEAIKTRMKAGCEACVATGEMLLRENPFPLRDGSVIWSSNTVMPFHNAEGRVVGLLVTTVDITELVNLRQAKERELASLASSFVTICAWCNAIKDDGEWIAVDNYLLTHPSSEANTELCPDCSAK